MEPFACCPRDSPDGSITVWNGTTIIQTVHHAGAAYPVVADPEVAFGTAWVAVGHLRAFGIPACVVGLSVVARTVDRTRSGTPH